MDGPPTASDQPFTDPASEAENLDAITLLAFVTHELRSPLQSFGHGLQLLKARILDSDLEPTLRALNRQYEVMSQLLEDCQGLLECGDAELQLQPEPVDINELLEQVERDWSWRCDERGLCLRREPYSGDAKVVFDPVRLEQVIQNLLGNAIRHTPSGGSIVLRVKAEGEGVALEVHDSGMGISAEDLGRVFEPFRRGRSSATNLPSLGLGLAIVRRLVEAHDGTVQAESAGLGHGALFRVSFASGPTTSGTSSSRLP